MLGSGGDGETGSDVPLRQALASPEQLKSTAPMIPAPPHHRRSPRYCGEHLESSLALLHLFDLRGFRFNVVFAALLPLFRPEVLPHQIIRSGVIRASTICLSNLVTSVVYEPLKIPTVLAVVDDWWTHRKLIRPLSNFSDSVRLRIEQLVAAFRLRVPRILDLDPILGRLLGRSICGRLPIRHDNLQVEFA